MKTLGAIIWFFLCIFMAVGIVAFAIIYAVLSVVLKKVAWRDFSFSLPNFKFAR